MVHDAQYPNRPKETLDEYRENPCERCSSVRRIALTWEEHRHHYLKATKVITITKSAWLCLGCGSQINQAGGQVTEQDPGWLPADQIAILKGRR